MKLIILLLIFSSVVFAREENEQLFDKRESEEKSISFDTRCGVKKYDPRDPSNTIAKRIVGGVIPRKGEWPWLVSLMVQEKPGIKKLAAAGALINDRWILTTAYNFEPLEGYLYLSKNPDVWTVRIGEHDMLGTNDDRMDLAVENIIIHSDRTIVSNTNNIALVKLKKAVTFDENVKAICIPNEEESLKINETCYVAGWGYQKADAVDISTVLKHLAVNVVSNSDCKLAYKNEISVNGIKETVNIVSSSLCAGSYADGNGPCQYDGGGPLMCSKADQWYASGLFETGLGCGINASFPDVYVRVSSYAKWINSIIST